MTSAKSLKAVNTSAKCFVPKSTLKSTTFPTISSTACYSTVQYHQSEHNAFLYNKYTKPTGKTTRPTVVISSDSDEIETVSGHVRV